MADAWRPRRHTGRCRGLLLAGVCAAAVCIHGSGRCHQLKLVPPVTSAAQLVGWCSLAGVALPAHQAHMSSWPRHQWRKAALALPETHEVLSPTLEALQDDFYNNNNNMQGSDSSPCRRSESNHQWNEQPRVQPVSSKGTLIPAAEQVAAETAARLKALDALAAGGLRPGQELELVSALDLGTVPWSEVPVSLKKVLQLLAADKGIDSLALNLSVAVQAKDYADGRTVPLSRLTNFYFMATAGLLGQRGPRLVVDTSSDVFSSMMRY
ncbi:unnamed protein product [Polarella glacialis]|uniref:Uncharacterized protein n=1 Tax=Polarella glacialis TaxID=89957 RepID=A0A813L305_POLGL|nr:unnamed protein product [Polarella glacialis]